MRISACIAAVALVACAPAKDGGDDDLLGPRPAPKTIKSTIGIAGGVLEHPRGARVAVPPGALTHDTDISIVDVDSPAETALGGMRPAGPFFTISTGGYAVSRPLEITLPVDGGVTRDDRGAALEGAASDVEPGAFLTVPARRLGTSPAIRLRLLREGTVGAALDPAGPLQASPEELPVATQGQSLSSIPLLSSAAPGATWLAQNPPPGIEVTGAEIRGTPGIPGRFAFSVIGTGSNGRRTEHTYVLDVEPAGTPVLALASVSPQLIPPHAELTTITVTGDGFTRATQVQVAGASVATTFLDPQHLLAFLPPALVATEHPLDIAVSRPAPAAVAGPVRIYVRSGPSNAVPKITNVYPTEIRIGTPQVSLSVGGTSIVDGTQIVADGTVLETVVDGPMHVRATLPPNLYANAKTLQIRLRTPPPGGGDSEPVGILVVYPRELVYDLPRLYALAIAGDSLYLLQDQPPPGNGHNWGDILRASAYQPLSGTTKINTQTLVDPSEIVADTNAVYALGGCNWSNGTQGTVYRIAAGQPTQQWSGHTQPCSGLVHDAGFLYWKAADGTILRAPKSGGQGFSYWPSARYFGDGASFYYVNPPDALYVDVRGGSPTKVGTLPTDAWVAAVAPDRFAYGGAQNSLYEVPRTTTVAEKRASFDAAPQFISLDSQGTYVVAGSKLFFVPRTGAPLTLCIDDVNPLDPPIVAAGYVWWLGQDQHVYRVTAISE